MTEYIAALCGGTRTGRCDLQCGSALIQQTLRRKVAGNA